MERQMSAFEIRFAPRENAAQDPIERAAGADPSIFVGDLCLTELEDRLAQTVRPTVRASAYRLAYWLAENWWRLRWEPERDDLDWRMSHCLAAAGGGDVWSALTLVGDGENVILRMRPSTATAIENIRYLLRDDVQIPVEAFVAGIDGFLDAVIDRLGTTGHPQTDLQALWSEVQAERRSPDAARWRKLEAIAGLDPDAEEGAFLDLLLAQQARTGLAAVEELLAAFKQAAPMALANLLDVPHRSRTTLGMPDIEPLRRRARAEPAKRLSRGAVYGGGEAPWQRAYRLADAARAHWGFEPGALSNARLVGALGMREADLTTPAPTSMTQLSVGYRDDAGVLTVTLGARPPTSRRFALARLVGDHLATADDERLLPATTAKTSRQKFQRAFAQQLLCPVEDLIAFLDTSNPNDDQIEDAAGAFDVSPLLIKTTLVNHGFIDRQALSE